MDQSLKSKCKRTAVAAIDFGTTYSGFAFSWKSDWQKVIVNNWNSGEYLSHKAPTVLLLNPDQSLHSFGYEAETAYSTMAEAQSDSDSDDDDDKEKPKCEDYYYFHRFKMILHDNNRLHRESKCKDLTGKEMNAMRVFTLSIKYLKDKLLETMNSNLVSDILQKDIDFILTVPAIWGDASKMFMREAAEKAGIGSDQLEIALEPEAASIYCQHLHMEKHDTTFDEKFLQDVTGKTKYMVVDLGGGTADITVHQKDDDNTLRELLPATGGPFGGTSVDNEFINFMHEIAGKDVFDKLKLESMEDHLTFFREFETKKRCDLREKVRIKIPQSLDGIVKKDKSLGGFAKALIKSKFSDCVHYSSYKLNMQSSVFEQFFQKTIEGIIKCIENIFRNNNFDDVKTIILVGGFSECVLVQNALKNKFADKKLIIPDEAGLAVVKGAVYFGHVPNVISRRVSRFTYGIQSWPIFNPEKDPPTKKVPIGSSIRCKDVFFPYVRQGEQIKAGYERSQVFQALDPKQTMLECAVFVSENKNPRYTDEKGMRKLGIVKVPLSQFHTSVEVEEKLIFGETEIKFKATDLGTGRSCEATFDMLDQRNIPGAE